MTERLVFAIFLSVVAAGLIITVLAQQGGQAKKVIGEAPSSPPDYDALLPPGSERARTAELVDSPTPTYVVAYKERGAAVLALAVWSKERGVYELLSPLPLSAGERRLAGVTSLTVERLGAGVPTMIFAKGPEATVMADGVMIVGREGSGLRLVQKLDRDGRAGAALFPVGDSEGRTDVLDVADIDGDGVFEVVATINKEGSSDVSVYVWANDRLEYQEELSWAMTMDKHLFPEPQS